MSAGFASHRRYNLTPKLLQLRVLRLGGDEDGNIRVGVSPEREEILIGRARLGRIALQHIGAGEAEMHERPDGFIAYSRPVKLARFSPSLLPHWESYTLSNVTIQFPLKPTPIVAI